MEKEIIRECFRILSDVWSTISYQEQIINWVGLILSMHGKTKYVEDFQKTLDSFDKSLSQLWKIIRQLEEEEALKVNGKLK